MLRSSDAQPNTPVRNHTKNKRTDIFFREKRDFFSILVYSQLNYLSDK